jgi:hypothetical protein
MQIDHASNMRGRLSPHSAPEICKSKAAWFRRPPSDLKDRRVADGETHQAFRIRDNVIHFLLGELRYWSRKVGELNVLERLYPECHLVNNSAQAMA